MIAKFPLVISVLLTTGGLQAQAPSEISREGNRLNLTVSGQGTMALIAESETVFSLSGVDAGVTFVVEPDGRVDQLIFRQSGRDRTARRKQPR